MAKLAMRGGLNVLMMMCALAGFLALMSNMSTRKRGIAPATIAVSVPDGSAHAPVAEAAPAPTQFAEYVKFDVAYLRWLWWPLIIYLFWGMAYVCDEYFVRTIDVIAERFKIPDDVAGATLMALGCNGPEMALNTINIFHPSNIGVGAVVGGEVFNVLVIIGTALLATPAMYMPLKLSKFNFFRDVFFYLTSVAMLYWVLRDGEVSRFNAAVLLCGAVVYTVTVTFSSQICEFFNKEGKVLRRTMTMTRKSLRTRLSLMPRASASVLTVPLADDELSESDSDEDADPATVAQWQQALECSDPEEGSVLGVKIDVRNRMMDRNHRIEQRFMCLRDDALVVSTLVDPRPDFRSLAMRAQSAVACDHNRQTHEQNWNHAGMVNRPVFLKEQEHGGAPGADVEAAHNQLGAAFSATPMDQLSRPPINGAPKGKSHHQPMKCPGPVLVPGFKEAPWEIIPLEDVLYCERVADSTPKANLHVHQQDTSLGHLITLELSCEDEDVMNAWVSSLQGKLLLQRRVSAEAPPAKTFADHLMEWIEWIQFPVKFWVARTIPDMDDHKLQYLYPVAFVMSMVWLAIFAFTVVKACDGIHEDFGISDDILGFTIAAAGTSFPNVFSGMCVAKQGKTSMAVANALGANVQNVFLALAVPWTIQSFFLEHGPFPMPVDNLLPAVLECAITLMPVVFVYLLYGFAMPRWAGGMFLVVYVIYVVFALGQQISKCPIWPLSCSP